MGVIPAVLFDNIPLNPELVIEPPAATIVTSLFLHGEWMHLMAIRFTYGSSAIMRKVSWATAVS